MIATLIVIVVILATMGVFYWRSSLVTMLATILSAIFASVVAFTYYEPIGNFIIRKGWFMEWSHGLSFLILFFLTLLLVRALSDLIIRSKIDLGNVVHISFTVVCGLFAGLLIAGHLLIGLALLPISPKLYLRYHPEQPLRLTAPSAPLFNPDGMSAGLYSWISRGSLSSRKSFAVFHPDFIQQVHVNRWAMGNGVFPILSPAGLKPPTGAQKPVRLMDFPEAPKLTVIRVGISTADMKSGGAKDQEGLVSLIPAQIPVIAVTADSAPARYQGTGVLLYPKGVVENGAIKKLELDQVLKFDKDDFSQDRMVWFDLAYDVPSGWTPALLTFKRNAIAELPKSVASTHEIEQELNPEKITPVRF